MINEIILASKSKVRKKILENNTLIFFTGVSRKANLIEKEKIIKFQLNKSYYGEILDICKEAKKVFLNNDKSKFLYEIAKLMNTSWELKKKLSLIFINKIYPE